MITAKDKAELKKLDDFLNSKSNYNGEEATAETYQIWEWQGLLQSIAYRLEIAPNSYRNATKADKQERYYTASCKCGWWGSSKYLTGGEPIADTGDHDECRCPVCGNWDIYEK